MYRKKRAKQTNKDHSASKNERNILDLKNWKG